MVVISFGWYINQESINLTFEMSLCISTFLIFDTSQQQPIGCQNLPHTTTSATIGAMRGSFVVILFITAYYCQKLNQLC